MQCLVMIIKCGHICNGDAGSLLPLVVECKLCQCEEARRTCIGVIDGILCSHRKVRERNKSESNCEYGMLGFGPTSERS